MSQIFKEFTRYIQKQGISANNRWRVDIPFPELLQRKLKSYTEGATLTKFEQQILRMSETQTQLTSGNNELNRGLELMCINAPFPGSNIDTTPLLTGGFKRHLPYAETHDVADFTFLCTSGMLEKHVFMLWKSLVLNKNTHKVGFYDDYITDLTIHQLDSRNEVKYSMQLIEAYPTIQTPIALDRTADKDVNQLSVSFQYLKATDIDETTTTTVI